MYTQNYNSMAQYVLQVHEIELSTSNIPVRIINQMLLHWEQCEIEEVDYLISMHELEALCETDIYTIHTMAQKALDSM